MKLNNLKINGYGKLSNKEIKLNKNINVIYGRNEAGKSTLLNFIKSIFYGASKNKNGKNISDYEKFLPWKGEEFSGKVSVELDNGEKYEIFRDFKKKNPIIYNENGQDISLEYPTDKSKGIDFISNKIGIDEDTFENTIMVAQNDIKINGSAQNTIIQKISNMVSSGDETISYKKTIDKINKMQLEEIGTERTREKPINVVNDKISELKNSKGKLEMYKSSLEENDFDIRRIQENIEYEETKLALYRVLKESNEKSKIKNKEIEVIRNIRDEYFKKIEELDGKIDEDSKEKIKKEKKSSVLFWISIIGIIIASIIYLVVSTNKGFAWIFLILGTFITIIEIIQTIRFKKSKKIRIKELEELENKIEQEIKIFRDNIKSRQDEIDFKQDEIKDAENEVNRIVMNKFEEKLDSDFIEECFELESDEIESKIISENDKINTLKIEEGAKQNQKEAMREELNGISKIQEKLDVLEDEKEYLMSLNNSYNLAKDGLSKAYENIRNSLSPVFSDKLSQISSKISNNKYEQINFNDVDGLIVQVDDGRFLPVERLSQGTIDQMYLGLRLASIDTISNENMPVILDETFAFFDDERLKNILEFINNEYKDRQIIIFTCSKRETEILEKLNINYNYVDLEK